MSNNSLTPLGNEIYAQIKRRKWSQRQLARAAGIDQSSISRLARGVQEPSHGLIEAIADALQMDSVGLKKLAGLRVASSHVERHSTVEYAASTIDAALPLLPLEVQELILEQLANLADLARCLADQPARTE